MDAVNPISPTAQSQQPLNMVSDEYAMENDPFRNMSFQKLKSPMKPDQRKGKKPSYIPAAKRKYFDIGNARNRYGNASGRPNDILQSPRG